MQSPVRAILILIFVAIPLLEIALLIKIGQLIGFWATILIVLVTAIVGGWLLHSQGMEALRRVLAAVDEGKPPVTPILDGLLLLMAGFLLLTPGVITDTIGIILLIPPVRQLLARHVLSRAFVVTVGGQTWREGTSSPDAATRWPDGEREAGRRQGRPTSHRPTASGPVIEGEFERIEERTVEPKRRKP